MLQLNEALSWDNVSALRLIESGHQLSEAALLFEKIEDEAIAAQLEKLSS
jgi:methionyl-tRNA synthetase